MTRLRIAQSQVNLLQPEFTTDQPDLQTILALVYEPLMHWRGATRHARPDRLLRGP